MATVKILITDPFPAAGASLLDGAADLEVEVAPSLEAPELLRRVEDVDGLIVRGATRVDAELLGAARRLRIVGRVGVGVDNIDVEAATRQGVVVVNAPTGSSVATAEHAVALMMAMARKIPRADASVKRGHWSRAAFMGCELRGKTIGIIGLGRIGTIVAQLAAGLGMKVVAHDPAVEGSLESAQGVELLGLDELLGRGDFISLHVPLTARTRGLIGAQALAKMKRGAYLVNCSRGGIVDEVALASALREGRLRGAALDVLLTEPPPPDHPLLALENVVFTPHLGSRTTEAQAKLAVEIAGAIKRFFQGREVSYAVNVPPLSGVLGTGRGETGGV